MTVALSPDDPAPWMIQRLLARVRFRSPSSPAVSWWPPLLRMVSEYVPANSWMMLSSVPASALNWSTASRRLPLPIPPSAKVVGVRVVGTQRPSKTSTNGRSKAVVRWRVMDVAPKKVRRFAAPVGTTTAQYERRPRPTQGQQEIFLGEQGRLPG